MMNSEPYPAAESRPERLVGPDTDRIVLNLGCGTKVSDHANVVNVDWSLYLRLRRNRLLRPLASRFLVGERRSRFRQLPDNILVWNLALGIPFPSGSVDAVYHSHLLEHLDRPVAERFLAEVRRVLKPNGIHRIAVPDLERLARDYLRHLEACDADRTAWPAHDRYVAAIIEQSVRRDAWALHKQPPMRRFIERVLVGDARRRGETHQWLYDRVSLSFLLETTGHRQTRVCAFNDSDIPGWSDFRLETNDDNTEYKPGSLYLEARV